VCKLFFAAERIAHFNTTEKGTLNRLIVFLFGTIFKQNPNPNDWKQVKEDRDVIEKFSLNAFFTVLANRAFQWARENFATPISPPEVVLTAIDEAVANNDQIVAGFFRVYVAQVTEEERKYNEEMRKRNPVPLNPLDKMFKEAQGDIVIPDYVFLDELRKAFKIGWDKKGRVNEKTFEKHGEKILLEQLGAERVTVNQRVAYKGIRLRTHTG
jgi:hypothetical protein